MTELILELSLAGQFRVRWSEEINQEWIRNAKKHFPNLTIEQLEDRKNDMDLAFPKASVTGYEDLISGLSLPDEDDRHVLAAAIVGRCDVIVTHNIKDFPEATLKPYGIEVQNPDEFLCYQYTLNELLFLRCAKTVRSRLVKPAISPEVYIDKLRKLRLEGVASKLENAIKLI